MTNFGGPDPTAFTGEIRAFCLSYAPENWLQCAGGIHSISAYRQLFMVIGNTYGGDGQTTFGVPNLCGRTIVGQGAAAATMVPYPTFSQYKMGQAVGSPGVVLEGTQGIPAHYHRVNGAQAQVPFMTNIPGPAAFLAHPVRVSDSRNQVMFTADADTTLEPGVISPYGSTKPVAHENRQPFLVVNFCICYDGSFPSPSAAG